MAEIRLAEPTVVDKMLEEGVALPQLQLDMKSAEQEARELLSKLEGYDANIADFGEGLPPIIVVRLRKAIVYIIVLDKGHILTGTEATKIVEELKPYTEKIKEAKLNPVLIFYSRKGKLTMASYLYLGSVIENHGVGILFVNGDHDEIIEILWHLENVGKYEAGEDEVVDLKSLK
ncbi:MAG: hypothetical protein F7C35_06235 [Desulfurococcales archaeon]|nr:hypothetical protein [Desulfurococcales archaeon]